MINNNNIIIIYIIIKYQIVKKVDYIIKKKIIFY